MAKVYFFDEFFVSTFPYLYKNLILECRNIGVDAHYVLQENDFRLTDTKLSKFYSSFSEVIKNPAQILSLTTANDLVIMRFVYKGVGGEIANRIVGSGKKLLMLDPAAVDLHFRACPAQWITAKSEWMKQKVLKHISKKYKNIFVTGTVHFDEAAVINKMKLNKKDFMLKYGLNPNKKMVVLTPANPADIGHQKGINLEYIKIIDVLKNKCKDYEILIKAHPCDYNANIKAAPGIIHKNEHYKNRPSWESFAPGVKVVSADEGYIAIKLSDCVLNVRSSIAMETPLLYTPLININRSSFTTNWPESKDEGIMKDIKIGDLADVLNKNKYYINVKSCDEYVKKYCYSNDGQSYKRIANVVKELIK